jgi:hypothetical protein
MGADQVASISRSLQDLHDARETGDPLAEQLCATITLPEGPNTWVQVMGRLINVHYPRAEDPLLFLSSIGGLTLSGIRLESWRANEFATFAHSPAPIDAVAEFVDRLLVALHGLDADNYSVFTYVQQF